MKKFRRCIILFSLLFSARDLHAGDAAPVALSAGGSDLRIEKNHLSLKDTGLLDRALALKGGGKLMDRKRVISAMKSPAPASITLLPIDTERLEPPAIAARARRALMRVGWFYRCLHCDEWHVGLAGGYIISANGIVATCWHCIAPEKREAKEAYLIAFDADLQAYPVTAVLAHDKELDAAIIRVESSGLSAVPLRDQCAAGDAAFVFSDPLEISGYFSAGMVNRCYWKDDKEHSDARSLANVRQLRVNVSTDWAPGSSGAAVFDACGNVIAHVEAIDALNSDGSSQASPVSPKKRGQNGDSAGADEVEKGTVIVLHEAVPARGVRLLVESMCRAAAAASPSEKGPEQPRQGASTRAP